MRHEDVPIEKIQIGARHRIDHGDIDALAANIREMGLLQPIGLDRYYQLIFGERRLMAVQLLNWEKAPCVVLDLQSVLAGEYAENEFRKQFTPSERAAIGAAIEKELGNRLGGDRRSVSANAELEKKERGNSVDLAAKRAGFNSAETFERAKATVAKGSKELIAAMDAGRVSIAAAAKIATQPKADQKRIVEMPKDEQREVVKQIRKTKADKEADERRARDLRVFRGLAEAVETIANFYEDAQETWAGLSRVSAFKFSEHLNRAIDCLVRIKREHPNEKNKPQKIAQNFK